MTHNQPGGEELLERAQTAAQIAAQHAVWGEQNGRLYDDVLYTCPSRVVFATYGPAALSLARRALTQLDLLAGNKVPYATDQKLAKRSVAQVLWDVELDYPLLLR